MTDETDTTGLSAFWQLANEARSFIHKLVSVIEQIHGQRNLTAGMRGVLEGIAMKGAQTVPQMAAARPVSRQHIQKIVNQLLKMELVQRTENPLHKRSVLVELSPKGKLIIEEVLVQEKKLFSVLEFGISDEDMRESALVLKSIRNFFESRKWQKIAQGIAPCQEN